MGSAAWWVFWSAALLTVLTTPLIRRWLVFRQVIDWPEARRSHAQPTPRGGGLAIWIGVLIALLLVAPEPALLSLVAFTSILALLGWLDDRHDVPVAMRLAVMLMCAAGLVWIVGPIPGVSIMQRELGGVWIWSVLGVIGVVWMINLHNFMDGADGLAAMQGAWSGGILGWLLYRSGAVEPGLLGMALAGACAGFLVWNRPPARLFMGDVGSIMLGGTVGLLAFVGAATGGVSIWISLIVCALFVVDATATLLLRVVRDGQWYTAHREHAYQRLIRSGWSHTRVLLLYAGLNLALVGPLLLLALGRPDWDWAIALLLIALLGFAWTVVQKRTLEGAPNSG